MNLNGAFALSTEQSTKKDQHLEENLLKIVRDFIAEFKSERVLHAVNLNASLERDLGIDSLGRVELFLRIEKKFSTSLPQSLMAEAESVNDILTALKKSGPIKQEIQREFAEVLGSSELDPTAATSLVDVLIRYVAYNPKRPHIYLIDENGEENIIRYGELLDSAKKVAAGLISIGIKPRDTVAIMLPTGQDFFYAFFGVLLAGGVPVPIYPPLRADKIEEYAAREANILNNAEVRVLITFSQVETLGKLLRVFIRSLRAVTTTEILMLSKHHVPGLLFGIDDPALIQYTSGSTSDPKGVLLSHGNLLANIRSVGKAVNLGPKDVGVSWLPLYHDMGLIGAWFCSLYHGIPLTIMSPLTFLSRPDRWLWAIHYHRGTISAGPNFAYEFCVRKIKDEDIQGLDLSSWRLAFNGAEMINPKTMERFTKKFEPFGFKPEAFYPVYGLAENTVALTFPPLNRLPRVDVIKREPFELEQRAVPAAEESPAVSSTNISSAKDSKTNLEFVGCGMPIPDHEIRVVDENNHELEERRIGALQFFGPSAMQGYYRNPTATQAVKKDGWLDTGDFAYIAEGEVFITGRQKDIIIKAGRNLYPQEIEEVTELVHGVRKGCVVALGIDDPKLGTEKIVIIAETLETNSKIRDSIIAKIIEHVSIAIGLPPDEVCLVPPRTVPKTSSGKLQRSASKQLYLQGKLSKKGLPVWMQFSKLFLKGAAVVTLQQFEKVWQFLYMGYIYVLLLFFLPVTWGSVLILPRKLAAHSVKILVRMFIGLSGSRLDVIGKERLTKKLPTNVQSPVIYVANHASYVDPLFLIAVLPPDVVFVGKKEIRKWPIIRTAVKKLDYLTVDRLDFSKNIHDTTLIEKAINEGRSVVIFPEGTFTYATGLRPFKLGAFKLAVDTEATICPISIQGTRAMMRGDSLMLKPGKVKITLSPLIKAESKDWSEVTRLYAETRAEIAQHCGESSIDLILAGP